MNWMTFILILVAMIIVGFIALIITASKCGLLEDTDIIKKDTTKKETKTKKESK